MATPFQITHNTLSITPQTKIIKAKEIQTFLEANEILNTAKQRANEIIQNAEQAYEQKKQEGYYDGQMEGKLEHTEKIMETVLLQHR